MLKPNRTVPKSAIETMDLTERVNLEAQITDERSTGIQFEKFKTIETRLDRYILGAPWRQYLFQFLGAVQGKTVLDVACGYSMTPVIFALAGAMVYAVDVAPKTVATVQRFAEYKGVGNRLYTHVGPVESLPFEDEKFDLVFGGAALHHFQLDAAALEIKRVLKPGGRGGFQDPLGHNPLLEFARDYLPYYDKHAVKGTDRPMWLRDVETFGRHFTSYHYHSFDLFTMTAKVLRLKQSSALRKALYAVDNALFDALPYLQRYARFVVTCVNR